MRVPFSFNLKKMDGKARRGQVITHRGSIETPAFMPVGTAATVKSMYPHQVRQLGADVILANTYHLMLRPGAERIKRLGGLHHFMNWHHPILTDSGGFQIMSLAKLRQLSEYSVIFTSHIDGSKHEMTPERSIEIQSLLGSDIQMQLDECVGLPCEDKEMQRAMELSLRWAERCQIAFGDRPNQALFGIVQGGNQEKLREQSAQALTGMDFKGYAIGGLAVGEPQEVMLAMLDVTCPILPSVKPRYLMGVGTPDDLLKAIARGVDMFDCVMPTRAGRHGLAFTRFGKVNLRNACHVDDPKPLDDHGTCQASNGYSRAYLHHLVRAKEALGGMLLTWHNLSYYQDLMKGARAAIEAGSFETYHQQCQAGWDKIT